MGRASAQQKDYEFLAILVVLSCHTARGPGTSCSETKMNDKEVIAEIKNLMVYAQMAVKLSRVGLILPPLDGHRKSLDNMLNNIKTSIELFIETVDMLSNE